MKHTMMKVLSVVMALTMIMGTFGMMVISAAECEHENCAETQVPATCGTYGYTLYECEDCGYSYAANLIAKKTECDPESAVEIPAVDAACGPDGHNAFTAGSYCGDCGEILVEPEEIPDTQPECTFEIVLDPANCEKPENEFYVVCTVCGYESASVSLDDVDANWENQLFDGDGKHNYQYEIITAPTCVKNGVARVTCEQCDLEAFEIKVLKNETLHEWVDVSIDATCTTDGQLGFACSNDGCDAQAGKDVATGDMIVGGRVVPTYKTGHNIVNVTDVEDLTDDCEKVYEAATCTKPGFNHWYCTNEGCPEFSEVQHEELTPAHQWPFDVVDGEIRNINYAYYTEGTDWDCITDRIDTYSCMVCGKTETRVGEKATGHNTTYVYNCGLTCATDACHDCTHANRTVKKACLNANCPYTDTTLLPDPEAPVTATEHAWVYTGQVEGTCTTLAYYTGYCSNAGCTVTLKAHEVEIPNSYVADNHEDTSLEKIEVEAPTCSKDGAGKMWCDACCAVTGEWIPYVIPQNEHVADINTSLVAKPATCAAAGWTEEKKCNNCGETTLASTPEEKLTECLESTIVYAVKLADATCTKGEKWSAYCTVCATTYAAKYKEGTNPANHVVYDDNNVATSTLVYVPYTAPTCLTTGTHAHIMCTACETAVKIVADKYDATAEIETVADLVANDEIADCDAPGCAHDTVEIAALGHDLTTYAAKAETCDKPGMIGGEVCNRCDYATENAGKVIPPHGKFNGTSYEFDPNGVYVNADGETFYNYVIDELVPPTCTEEGEMYGEYCMICLKGDLTTHIIPKRPHSITGSVKNPTCTEAGYTVYKCVNCDTVSELVQDATSATGTREDLVWYIDGYTKALGHNFVDYDYAGSCTEPSEEGEVCTVCGEKQNVEYGPAPKGHKIGNEYVDLSCVGIMNYIGNKCACGETITIDDMTHNIVTGIQEPTCTEVGVNVYACADCGLHFVDEEGSALTAGVRDADGNVLVPDGTFAVEVPALGHSVGLVAELVLPTKFVDGYVVFQCATCGENMEPIAIPSYGYEEELTVSLNASAYNATLGAYDGVAVNSGKIAVTLSMTATEFQYKILDAKLWYNTDLLTYAGFSVDFAFDVTQAVETNAHATGGFVNIISRSTTPVTVEEVAPNVTVAGEDVAFITIYFEVKDDVYAPMLGADILDDCVVIADFAFMRETEGGLVDKTSTCDLIVENDVDLSLKALGDVSGDGEINMGDLVTLTDLLYTADADYVPSADIDRNGTLNIVDIALLENYLLTNRTETDYLAMIG